MLTIISSAETTNKTMLSAFINAALNNVVPHDNETQDAFSHRMLNLQTPFHYKMQFRAIMHDHGITDGPMFPEGGDYARFINAYTTRVCNNLVVCGNFSKTFINKVTSDIEDVVILNITRHPTVAYLLDAAEIDPRAPYNTNMRLKRLKTRFNTAFIQQSVIRTLPNVHTIKYEDIIASGYITVRGNDITLPPYYSAYNRYITNHERDHKLRYTQLDESNVNQFNESFSTFNLEFSQNRDDVPVEIVPLLPHNMFNALDYTPINIWEILKGSEV